MVRKVHTCAPTSALSLYLGFRVKHCVRVVDVGWILDRVVNMVGHVVCVIPTTIDLRTVATSCSYFEQRLGNDFWHWVGLFRKCGFGHIFIVNLVGECLVAVVP